MLILNRNIGESIHIGDDVRLTVIDVNNDQVRIGIHAPREIPVHREEIYYRIKHQQESAQAASSGGNTGNDFNNHPSEEGVGNASGMPSHRRWPMCWSKTQRLS